METKPSNFGGSLRVPCVQELAKGSLHAVPPRYLRLDQDGPLILSDSSNSLPTVPIIDLQKLLSEDFGETELDRLDHACKEWGFFQLINHGVSTSLLGKVKLEIQEFFNLPIEEKQKYWQQPGSVEGYGSLFVLSEDQKLDWGDLFYMITLPTHLRKSHLVDKLSCHFRLAWIILLVKHYHIDTLETYSYELKNIAMKLLYQMAKALKMEANDIKTLFEEGRQGMRMNYYPPCPQPEHVIGLTPHSDACGLTILLQINETDGLQIRKDGKWIPVKPLPEAFVVNIGDTMEIVSNGIYRSIEHRATINSVKERLSVATFHSPKLDGDMGPAPSLVTPEKPPKFRRIDVRDYYKGFYSRKLYRKSNLDFMRIANENDNSA